ncbi:hypothetical protein [Xanthomonas albilineans]|uniref:hypothetical protein n=1 Tax=Xanthomonas albilineans TaxID=29447 RepID=UPI000A918E80|nr:hypothetical protein [Xanthomonas albilineans]
MTVKFDFPLSPSDRACAITLLLSTEEGIEIGGCLLVPDRQQDLIRGVDLYGKCTVAASKADIAGVHAALEWVKVLVTPIEDNPTRIVICEDQIDGSTAYSRLPLGYAGPCAMKYRGRDATYWALFPTTADGMTAARMANRHDIGGYNDVEVHLPGAAPQGTEEFDSADDWLLS